MANHPFSFLWKKFEPTKNQNTKQSKYQSAQKPQKGLRRVPSVLSNPTREDPSCRCETFRRKGDCCYRQRKPNQRIPLASSPCYLPRVTPDKCITLRRYHTKKIWINRVLFIDILFWDCKYCNNGKAKSQELLPFRKLSFGSQSFKISLTQDFIGCKSDTVPQI